MKIDVGRRKEKGWRKGSEGRKMMGGRWVRMRDGERGKEEKREDLKKER